MTAMPTFTRNPKLMHTVFEGAQFDLALRTLAEKAAGAQRALRLRVE